MQVSSDIEANAKLLRKVDLFKDLRTDLLLQLASSCRMKYADEGEVLIDEAWSTAPGLFLIISGEARVERRLGRERVVIARRVKGEVLGELSLLDGKPPSATVVAATDLDALLLPASEFSKCLDNSPRIGREIIKILAGRLREETEARVQAQTKDVMGRVAAEILRIAERQAPGDPKPVVRLEASQTELGRKLGATRESVNKALRRLQVGERPPLTPFGRQRGVFRIDADELRQLAAR